MKFNIFIMCLIDDYGVNLANKVANLTGYNFYNFSEAFNLPQINSKSDLNKLIQNSNLNIISAKQIDIISKLKNSVIYSNNFNLLSQNFLLQLKKNCAVVYVKVDKNYYLEHMWQQNLNNASKFKVDIKVFETRNIAYSSLAEVVINLEENINVVANKLIKKLEKI